MSIHSSDVLALPPADEAPRRDNLARPASRTAKAVFDNLVAAIALALLSPVFLVICAIIRMDGGPAFFGHGRVGAGGQRFRCLTFRSMSVRSDRGRDQRVTRIGEVLRRTGLNALPQLLNVLRGEMSLVGPRALAEDELPHYGQKIGVYYRSKPGMTGLWQVGARSSTERRVRLDVWYARNWSLLRDIAILLRSLPAAMQKHGAA